MVGGSSLIWGKWPSRLKCYYQNRNVPAQTSLGARPESETQSRYEAADNLLLQNVKTQ